MTDTHALRARLAEAEGYAHIAPTSAETWHKLNDLTRKNYVPDLRALLEQHDADQARIAHLESVLIPLIHHAEWAARYNPELQGAVNEARIALKGTMDDDTHTD